MKKMLLSLLLTGMLPCLQAQNLPPGARVPDTKALSWLTAVPQTEGKVVVYDFFHPADPACEEVIPVLDALAKRYGDRIAVIRIAREHPARNAPPAQPGAGASAVAIDATGKVFGAFGVEYVPCCIVADRRGRIVWTGVPAELETEIKRLLEPQRAGVTKI